MKYFLGQKPKSMSIETTRRLIVQYCISRKIGMARAVNFGEIIKAMVVMEEWPVRCCFVTQLVKCLYSHRTREEAIASYKRFLKIVFRIAEEQIDEEPYKTIFKQIDEFGWHSLVREVTFNIDRRFIFVFSMCVCVCVETVFEMCFLKLT